MGGASSDARPVRTAVCGSGVPRSAIPPASGAYHRRLPRPGLMVRSGRLGTSRAAVRPGAVLGSFTLTFDRGDDGVGVSADDRRIRRGADRRSRCSSSPRAGCNGRSWICRCCANSRFAILVIAGAIANIAYAVAIAGTVLEMLEATGVASRPRSMSSLGVALRRCYCRPVRWCCGSLARLRQRRCRRADRHDRLRVGCLRGVRRGCEDTAVSSPGRWCVA